MLHQTKKYCVRNFGNDREYENVQELVSGLREHYTGQSIAIHVRTSSGMLRALFVDVDDEGEMFESYADQGPVRVSSDALVAVAR